MVYSDEVRPPLSFPPALILYGPDRISAFMAILLGGSNSWVTQALNWIAWICSPDSRSGPRDQIVKEHRRTSP